MHLGWNHHGKKGDVTFLAFFRGARQLVRQQ